MNPAYSVIVFTVSSGAGYGLLVILSMASIFHFLPDLVMLKLCILSVSLMLITAGLISSTSHLGHPERAWRAISQWRTSWLSREGLFAIITYIPALLLWFAWFIELNQSFPSQWTPKLEGYIWVIETVVGICAISTVFCTGQIYATLNTIPAWCYSLTTPIYCILSLTSGLMLWIFLHGLFNHQVDKHLFLFSIFILEAAFVLKCLYWRFVDNTDFGITKAEAIGFEKSVQVQNLEPAHQTQNYLMREMGFHVARKHSVKLRWFASWASFIVPGICLLAVMFHPPLIFLLSIISVLSLHLGLLTERWLFFAEAKHIVTLYY